MLGTIGQQKVYERGTFSVKMVYKKARLDLDGEPSLKNFVEYASPQRETFLKNTFKSRNVVVRCFRSLNCISISGNQRRFTSKCIENTFQCTQNTCRSLEKHSKRRHKICVCSVILGELESFQNYKGFSIIFPKIIEAIRGNSTHYESANFSDSPLHHIFCIFESENFSFPLSYEKQPNLGCKMLKIILQKSVGNL